MIIIAKNTNVTVTPRKIQLLAESVKDMKPLLAIEQLSYLNYSAALPLLKTIKQAIANAKNNYQLSEDVLRFRTIYVGKGITYKKGRPGPRGRFKPYEKTRSNITVELIAPDAPKAKVLKASPATQEITKKQTTKKITKKETSPKGKSASGEK